MKKKFLSCVIALAVALTLFVPVTFDMASAKVTITPRTSLPSYSSEVGKKWYYTNNNVYYKYDYGPNLKYLKSRGGYCRGNCTWYAYGRAGEILGKTFNSAFRRNAGLWYSINKSGHYYPYGSKPKVGAIACYSNHVAVVEKIVNGKVYVSESGWKIGAKPTTASKIYFHYGTPWYSKAKGYIYICDGETAPETEPTYTTTATNYQVKITAADLNMRTGPGTSYDTMGYVKPGTYTINAESNGWGRLSTNGYWVSLSYTTKLNNTQQTDPSETTSTTTTAPTTTKPAATTTTSASKYQIKVSISDLNMRTGPGTSYKSKGHIKKGTYDVTQEKNGWAKIKTNGYWVSLKYVTKITKATTKATTTTSTTKATSATTTQKATTKATSASQSATTAASGKFNVKVTASNLVMRSGAGTKYKNKGTLKKGKVCTIKKVKNGWGQIAGNGYWVKLKYTKLSGTANVKVTAKDLNMRKGAGTQYKSVGHVKKGTHKIKAMKNGWVQLASNGYWVSLSYVKLV